MHCEAYINDAIIYNDEWNHHLETIRAFFDRLSEAKLTINLSKSEFWHANLTFLGHVVGQDHVKPVEAKVYAISDFPVPTCKRQLMTFLVWPIITENLLRKKNNKKKKKKKKYKWTSMPLIN